MKQDSFSPLDADRFSVSEHASVDREGPVADFIAMRHTLGKRGFHGGLALFFECLHLGWRSQEILRHVSAAAESWLKLLEHEKHLAIISTRLVRGLNVHGPNFATVLSSGEVRTRAVMRVIEAEARWPRCENDPPLAMRRNERCAFLGRS